MKRRYEHRLIEHFRAHQQRAFLFGPRPVVKTTTAHAVAEALGKHLQLFRRGPFFPN